jgi:hypothetical protein
MNPLGNPFWNAQAGIPAFLKIPLVNDLQNPRLLSEQSPDRIFAKAPQP